MDLGAFWPAFLAGSVLGILTGLGIGGGSLLILWLTLAVKMDPSTARAVSLLFFFPAALISTLLRRGAAAWKRIFPAVLTGCISAGGFSLLRQRVDEAPFEKLLGIVLILVGIYELFHRAK